MRYLILAMAMLLPVSHAKEHIELSLALRNWGLDNSHSSHINARKAWKITQGSKKKY